MCSCCETFEEAYHGTQGFRAEGGLRVEWILVQLGLSFKGGLIPVLGGTDSARNCVFFFLVDYSMMF